jgi:hypothetical protein
MFSADEIRCHLARPEPQRTKRDAENRETDEDEFHYESPAGTFAKSVEAY